MGISVFCQYNAFGARPSRGLVNVGVGLMTIRKGQFVDGTLIASASPSAV